MAAQVLRPRDAADVLEALRAAAEAAEPVDLVAGATKEGLGRPPTAARRLDLSALAGIGLYEAEELVLTAAPATPLAEIEGLLTQHRQFLAFEPLDMGPLYGLPAGRQTLGGAVAANLSGPRRIKAGAARDHLLGFKAASGWGEAFKSGGRVVKNVTGYDMCKLMAGSHGTLAALTEITVKVLPAPEKTRTVLLFGCADADAVAALAAAGGSPHEVSGLAHLPAPVAGRSTVGYVGRAGAAVTAVRVEGPAPSVEHRCAALRTLLGGWGAVEELHGRNSRVFWQEVRDVATLLPDGGAALWRVSVAPSAGPGLLAAVAALVPAEGYYDWAGGLVWLAVPPTERAAQAVRGVLAAGHATLVRAPEALRLAVAPFQPQPAALARLTGRVKRAFDPDRILNRGRMYEGL